MTVVVSIKQSKGINLILVKFILVGRKQTVSPKKQAEKWCGIYIQEAYCLLTGLEALSCVSTAE